MRFRFSCAWRTDVAVLSLTTLAAACSAAKTDTSTTVDGAKSSLARDTSPSESAADATALAQGNEAFALAALGSLGAAPPRANLTFAPYSLSLVLAMTYAGARAQTATEMATALRFTLPPERLHPAFDALDLALASRGTAANAGAAAPTLHVADSLWAQKGLVIEPPFLDTLAVD